MRINVRRAFPFFLWIDRRHNVIVFSETAIKKHSILKRNAFFIQGKQLEYGNIHSSRPFFALLDVECNSVTFFEGFEAA